MQAEIKYLQSNIYTILPAYAEFHSHANYEMIYFYSGEGVVNCDQHPLFYASDTLVIIPPMMAHDEVHFSATSVTFINFTLDKKDLITSPIVYSEGGNAMTTLMKSLCNEYKAKDKYSKEKCNAMLLLLIIDAIRSQKENDILLEGSKQVMDDQDDPLIKMHTQKTYADIGYSYDRYRHVFKNKMGVSPHQFIIQSRIRKSEYLLKYTTLSVTEIAMQCGFASSAYFSKQFKKHNMMSPKMYRETQETQSAEKSFEQSDPNNE